MPTARPSFSLGNMSLNIEYAEGDSAASPTPTPMRARNMCRKFLLRPQAAVARLQNTTPTAMIFGREKRSAR
ncbi:hypothetical protein D3C87_1623700 [compost metagenome]